MVDEQVAPLLEAAAEKYGERLRCGFVRAPMDWAHPEHGDIVIGASKLSAGKPEARRGALLLNPGGPGADGFFLSTLKLLDALADSNPDDPQGAMQLRLLGEYDIVGFSPRGTGASTRFKCASDEQSRFVDLSASGWDTPDNIANANYNDRKAAEACLQLSMAPYVNTDATARDMDLLRGLLGDERLNFIGYSYGTWLGAWYASLFPEKVGRMVLDSSMDFTGTFEQQSLAQPLIRQRLLDEVLVPYAVRHASHFQLGRSEAEVQALITSLSPRMQAVLSKPLSDLTSSRSGADFFLRFIGAAKGLDAVLKVADPSDTEAVEQGLQDWVFHPDDEALDGLARFAAKFLFQQYLSMWVLPPGSSVELGNFDSVFWSVQCNDTPATTDLSAWAEQVRDLTHRAPMFFQDNYRNICAFWGGPRVSKPDLAPMKPLDVLFVQSQYDGATYTEGANRFFAQLPKASRVYVPGDYQHGIYPYVDRCVDPAVTSYLLGEPLPQREISCTAQPLPQDDLAQEAGPEKSSASQVYMNPRKALELIEDFKQGLSARPETRNSE